MWFGPCFVLLFWVCGFPSGQVTGSLFLGSFLSCLPLSGPRLPVRDCRNGLSVIRGKRG